MDETTRKETASKLFEDLSEIMETLYERWQDEKKYEDIHDYSAVISPRTKTHKQ